MTKRILVVEDDPILNQLVTDVIRRKGFDVSSAENGVKALETMQNQYFHLIISDFKMDKMDGLALLSEVKKQSPSTEFVMITAFGTISNAVDAIKQGAFDYLTKPVELDELNIVIQVDNDWCSRAGKYQCIVDATPGVDVIDASVITQDSFVVIPGVPCGLSSEAREKLSNRYLHDPLQIGAATMVIDACRQ